ncbi:unnamed protein product [marine sediment metagenome]|uniref:Uncharacterized protein n=1 Tax=marine sediment metagenome TaxID=412755 RepID=X0ZUY2_9ZZZZ
MKVILATAIDLLSPYNLITSRGGFLLSRREDIMVDERDLSPEEGWNTVFVDREDTVDILNVASDKTGIPKHQIVDHLIRLIRDLKMLSADNKGYARLREAIEQKDNEVQVEKLHTLDPEALERIRETGFLFEYPMFAKRMKVDRAFAQMAERASKNPDLVRALARNCDSLSPTTTHSFICLETGDHLVDAFEITCPFDGAQLLEVCIEGCERLSIERRTDFKMPRGFSLEIGLAERIGLGRPINLIINEAIDKAREEYLKTNRAPLD